VRNDLTIGTIKQYKPGKTHTGTPDVRGYNLRDAINILESAGIDVSFHGTGYVIAQSLSPGTPIAHGSRINLTLAQ
jgi:beta-lactam-binding protein with PASTA domain